MRLDGAKGPGQGREVSVSMGDYAAIDHGYATTIHKAQGATVDRAYVLASESMDRHLSYVAMTRHREERDALRRPRRVSRPCGAVGAAVALGPRRRRSITPNGGESPGAARSSCRSRRKRPSARQASARPSRREREKRGPRRRRPQSGACSPGSISAPAGRGRRTRKPSRV